MSFFLSQELLREHVERRLPQPRSGRRPARLISLQVRRLQHPITQEDRHMLQATTEHGSSTNMVPTQDAAVSAGETNPAHPSVWTRYYEAAKRKTAPLKRLWVGRTQNSSLR